MEETELYRCYGPMGVLLYVGISGAALKRLAVHCYSSDWYAECTHISISRYPTRAAAVEAERAAIRSERPFFNVIENSVVGPLPIPLPGSPGFFTWCQRRATLGRAPRNPQE